MTSAVTNAIAQRQQTVKGDPRALVKQYTEEFSSLLPTHIKSEMFMRAAAGALRTGRMTGGEFDLEVAARNNPQAFINTLRTAARLGLAPGTEEFYLTPRKVRGRPEILGVVGYQGYIELMFRAGYVSSVVVDTVHEGEPFNFVRGRDEQPEHIINWRAKRGALELVYAYAKMKDGGTSYVVVLNQFDIEAIKEKSASWKSGSSDSPWRTDERAMWLKSAIRRLKTWVPTSTERVDLAPHSSAPIVLPDIPVVGHEPVPTGHQVQVDEPDEVIDAEIVEPDVVGEVPPAEEEPPPADEPAAPTVPPMTKPQQRKMMALFGEKGFTGSEDRHAFITDELKIEVTSSGALTFDQAKTIIEALDKLSAADPAPSAEVASDGPADGAAQ